MTNPILFIFTILLNYSILSNECSYNGGFNVEGSSINMEEEEGDHSGGPRFLVKPINKLSDLLKNEEK